MKTGRQPVSGTPDPAAAVAAFGLPASHSGLASPLEPGAWQELKRRVAAERIEGLLAAAVAGGGLEVDPEQREDVRRVARGRACVDLELERELVITAGVLDAAGVSYRVLKGLVWAHTVYPDPSWRGSGDVDLLIASRDWYQAVAALEAGGARRVLPEVRPGFDRRFGKDATLRSRDGWELDLHRLLVVGPYGLWVDQAELLARRATVTIGAAVLPVLDAEAAFLHACYNLVLGDDPPRLIAARDVSEMVLGEQADPAGVAELARRWNAGPIIIRALSQAEAMLGARLWDRPLGGPFLPVGLRPGDRALMAMYRGPGRGYSSQGAAIIAIPGAGDRLTYLRSLVWPQRTYLEARGLSTTSYVRQALRKTWGRV
jgi:hypothetical protein